MKMNKKVCRCISDSFPNHICLKNSEMLTATRNEAVLKTKKKNKKTIFSWITCHFNSVFKCDMSVDLCNSSMKTSAEEHFKTSAAAAEHFKTSAA